MIRRKQRFKVKHSLLILPVVGVVALVGVAVIVASRAATPTASLEPESGTLAGSATRVSDSGASGGQGVAFGSAAVGGKRLVWSDEFDGTSLDTSKWSMNTGGETQSQAIYATNNVSVSGGYLHLRSRRHCVNSTSDALIDANASTAPCASGKITRYSSGYVRTGYNWQSGRIEVRAKLPAAQRGAWPAIWTHNPVIWCNPNYGEIDIMEWYYDVKPTGRIISDVTTATTHLTCYNETTKYVEHYHPTGTDLTANWHTWAVDWDSDSVRYEMDGRVLTATTGSGDTTTDTLSDFGGLSYAQMQDIMNTLWQIRINTQIIKSDMTWHNAPDNAAYFPVLDFQVDYVRVYQ